MRSPGEAMWSEKIPADLRILVRPGRPVWVRPMLARLHEDRVPQGRWGFERKFDGQRVMAVCDPDTPGGARLVTRNGIDVTGRYPELLHELPADRAYALDAEIVAFDQGKDSFSRLQHRMHRKDPDPSVPVDLLAFDIVNLDYQDLRALPLEHRRMLLKELALSGRAAVVPYVEGEPSRLLERACEAGWEGLIAKRLDAPYTSGRSGDWLKLKCHRTGEFRIGGYTTPQGTRTGFGALLLGEQTDEGLRYVGKVGTGFDERSLGLLLTAMKRISRDDPPFLDPPRAPAKWVDPVLVCRVDYTERTTDGRLRHPSFMGLLSPSKRRAVH